MNRLGIETISVFALPPVEFVRLAGDLGLGHVSMGLTSLPINPHGYAPFDLRSDAGLRRDTKLALADNGICISLAEGLTIRPGIAAADRAQEQDVFAELGATRVNVVSMDPDMARTLDQMALTAEMAAARGMVTTTELAPGLTIDNLSKALAAVAHIGRADFQLLIDTMHLVRSGSSPADLAAIDPALIDYAQLCDAPLVSTFDSYMTESMTERLCPGAGELPLLDILRLIPRDRVIGLELPLLSQAQAGIGPLERMRPVVAAARELLARLDD